MKVQFKYDKFSQFWKTFKIRLSIVGDDDSDVLDSEDEEPSRPASHPPENISGFPFPSSTGQESATLTYRFLVANKSTRMDDEESFEYEYENAADDETEDTGNRTFFNDLTRQVDFVLAVNIKRVKSSLKNYDYLSYFLRNAVKKGLQFEMSKGVALPQLRYIKFYCPSDILLHYAKAFRVRLSCKSFFVPEQPKFAINLMETCLTRPNPNSYMYHRAKDTLSCAHPQRMTPTERIMIVYKLLADVRFLLDKREINLDRLMYRKIIVAAYPLHPGPWEWSDDGLLNDRQLLRQFWARMGVWYKYQPLNVIEKYFGVEAALYFGFLGFYNKMLMVASAVSITLLALSPLGYRKRYGAILSEVKNSTTNHCFAAYTRSQFKEMRHRQFSKFSTHAKYTGLLDSPYLIANGVFIALWAIVFLQLWRRQLNSLYVRYNIREKKSTRGWRTKFERYQRGRMNPLTGLYEPYSPLWWDVLRHTGAVLFTLLLIAIIVPLGLTSVLLRILYLEPEVLFMTPAMVVAAAAAASLVPMGIISAWYHNMAVAGAHVDSFKTQAAFDLSYVYKRFLYSFFNNYTVPLYMALYRGNLTGAPVLLRYDSFFYIFRGDNCYVCGCLLSMLIHVSVVMGFKYLLYNVVVMFWPFSRTTYQKAVRRRGHAVHNLGQWEQDFLLKAANRFYLINSYVELAIQYGYVVFFSAACPLAPAIALLSNLIQMRLMARRLVRTTRRLNPTKRVKTSVWFGIIQGMTYLGVAINAFVVSFTSDLLRVEMWRNRGEGLKGYITNATTTSFEVPGNGICKYFGMRDPKPPFVHAVESYQPQTYRLLAALSLEHVYLFCLVVVAYAIPSMPHNVSGLIQHHRFERRKKRLQEAKGHIILTEETKDVVLPKLK